MNTTPAPTASEAVTDETIIRSLVASRSEAEQLVAIEDMRGGGEMVVTLEDLRAVLALQPAISGAVPTGWKLVPVEPSAAMKLASKRYKAKATIPTGPGVYRAMIEAAPAAPIEAAQPASSSAPAVGAVRFTDAQIESELQSCGGKWEGSYWMLEDADLHPYVRTIEARAALAAPSTGQDAAQAVTDEQICHLWDTHVGPECAKHPLTVGDTIAFARAVLAAQGDGGTTA